MKSGFFALQSSRFPHPHGLTQLVHFGNFIDVTPTFTLFGIAHILILVAVALAASFFSLWARRNPGVTMPLRVTLATFLLVNEISWYSYNVAEGWVQFPFGLPLDLCDIVVWLTLLAAYTKKPGILELAYYWGPAGSSLAILTPDLGAPMNTYPVVHFFLAHGGVVVINVFLVWGMTVRPRQGSVWRALFWLNVYAIVIGAFDAVFHANYFYLCDKPGSVSLLTYMGPWPFYILTGEVLAVTIFWLLSLPFRGD